MTRQAAGPEALDPREPPGTVPPGGPPPRWFPRLMEPPTDRHLSPGRRVVGVLAVLAAVALLGTGAAWVVGVARREVDDAPGYRLSYPDIHLDPPPPRWFRGGSAAFLDRVLGGSDEFRSFSALNFDPEHLRLFFRLNAWVEGESGVTRAYPNQVTVRLKYREPVAVERLRLEDTAERTVVDRDGVILPAEDVEPAFLKTLVRLCKMEPPADPKPGKSWDLIDPKSGMPVRNERVLAAARLASFLRERLAEQGSGVSPFPRVFIQAYGESEFYLQVGPNLLFHWDEAEPERQAERLRPEEKWAYLRDFISQHPPKDNEAATHWKFTKHGIEPELPPPEPKQDAQPVGKVAVRRTKGSTPAPPTRNPPG